MTEKKGTHPGGALGPRQRAEAALRECEANFAAAIDATDESIYLLTVDETLLAVNDAAARSPGRSREDSIGRNLSGLLPPDVIERCRPFIDRLILTGAPVIFEDDRAGRWMINHLYPVRDAEGRWLPRENEERFPGAFREEAGIFRFDRGRTPG
jgi:PAS domain S-box-containing protein